MLQAARQPDVSSVFLISLCFVVDFSFLLVLALLLAVIEFSLRCCSRLSLLCSSLCSLVSIVCVCCLLILLLTLLCFGVCCVLVVCFLCSVVVFCVAFGCGFPSCIVSVFLLVLAVVMGSFVLLFKVEFVVFLLCSFCVGFLCCGFVQY